MVTEYVGPKGQKTKIKVPNPRLSQNGYQAYRRSQANKYRAQAALLSDTSLEAQEKRAKMLKKCKPNTHNMITAGQFAGRCMKKCASGQERGPSGRCRKECRADQVRASSGRCTRNPELARSPKTGRRSRPARTNYGGKTTYSRASPDLGFDAYLFDSPSSSSMGTETAMEIVADAMNVNRRSPSPKRKGTKRKQPATRGRTPSPPRRRTTRSMAALL